MNLHEAIERFLAEIKALGYSERTVLDYGQDLVGFERFVGEKVGEKAITADRISPLWVEAFLVHGQPTPTYRNRKLSALRSLFRNLKRTGVVKGDQDPTLHVAFAKVPRKEPSYLSYEEYLAILKAARYSSRPSLRIRNQAILVVLYNTGLRLMELCSLDVEQFDRARALFIGMKRKGGRVLDFPLNANAVQAVTVWLKARSALYVEPTGPLFVNTRRERISRRTVERLVTHCSQEAGIQKPVTPHTFRHSHCTEIQKRGASMETARQLMDHRRIETTARYSHSNDEAQRHALIALEDPSIFLVDIDLDTDVNTTIRETKQKDRTCRPISHWAQEDPVDKSDDKDPEDKG